MGKQIRCKCGKVFGHRGAFTQHVKHRGDGHGEGQANGRKGDPQRETKAQPMAAEAPDKSRPVRYRPGCGRTMVHGWNFCPQCGFELYLVRAVLAAPALVQEDIRNKALANGH